MMLAIHDLPLFVLSGVLLNICPGPDTLYVISRGGAQGWPAGAVAALGITSGCMVHILAATLGLSAVLAASATAFSVVKWAGAAYLVYVGLGMLRTRGNGANGGDELRRAALRTVYVQGFLTNVLNPKVALFFLAFLPQFIDPAAAGKAWSFLVLGALFNTTGTLWSLILAWTSARAGAALLRGGRLDVWLTRTAGGLFVAFGLRLALSERG